MLDDQAVSSGSTPSVAVFREPFFYKDIKIHVHTILN